MEADIAARDARKADITELLNDEKNISDAEVLRQLTEEYQALDRESDVLFTRWEEISLEIERRLAEQDQA